MAKASLRGERTATLLSSPRTEQETAGGIRVRHLVNFLTPGAGRWERLRGHGQSEGRREG